ncbi:hypothetical protein FNF29_02639 [Cafeteria roenbergensis]|uniref:Uncharacterized protein n=1 Tax=Cafeteria roenbergensis TaxID=33653 RepID=A0A5A8CLQ0_CAFRO|nr:hypothetical protein FNF29_02639 [Cafeteria roenbergensis]|eukprot:KAA0154016.1 hypothetical protein FNF29_02639 [Cafeteria roenbergensis]
MAESVGSPHLMASARRVIAVLGATGSGKSSLCRRVAHGTFDELYTPSRLSTELSCVLSLGGEPVMIELRDAGRASASSGDGRLGLSRLDIAHAHAILLVYRVDQPSTLEALHGTVRLLGAELMGARPPPLGLVGTHIDCVSHDGTVIHSAVFTAASPTSSSGPKAATFGSAGRAADLRRPGRVANLAEDADSDGEEVPASLPGSGSMGGGVLPDGAGGGGGGAGLRAAGSAGGAVGRQGPAAGAAR